MAKEETADRAVQVDYRYTQRRFDLVKIVLEKALSQRDLTAGCVVSSVGVGALTVLLADAVLAAMEQTPDTGPSAEEIERRARALAGDVLSEVEQPNLEILRAIRAEIQIHLDADLKAHAASPTTNIRVGGYRHGGGDAYRHILAMLDAAMEKTGAENV